MLRVTTLCGVAITKRGLFFGLLHISLMLRLDSKSLVRPFGSNYEDGVVLYYLEELLKLSNKKSRDICDLEERYCQTA